MAFILKSTKLIHSLARFSSQRGLIGRRKNYFFLKNLNAFDFNQSPLRTTASLPATDNKERDYEFFEKSLFQLSRDVQNHNVLVDDVKDVFNAIKQRGELTYPQLILLLKCCSEVTSSASNEERIKLAEDIWNTASKLGTQFHISHYNALLNVFLENNHKFSPSEFLSILENEGIEPSLVTYRRLLRAYCQQGNIEGANSVLDRMKKLNLPVSEEDFNSLILGYCETGDLAKAHDTIKIMQEKDIDPSSKTYTYLLCGYAKHEEIEKIKDLMKALPDKDIFLTEYQLLEIVYALAVNNRAEHIDFILEQLGNSSYQVGKAANRIIQRLLNNKMDSVALRIFEQIERMLQSPQFVTNKSRNILSHYVVNRSPEEILDLCQKMEVKGWYKTALSYVLREVFLRKNEQFCMKLLDAMRARKMELRSHYYWPAIIKASEKGNTEMFNVLKSIPRSLISDSLYTVSRIILPNCQLNGDWRSTIDSLASFGLKRSILARCFMEKFLSEGKFDKVEKIALALPVYRPLFPANYFARLLATHPEEDKRFVNVVYSLAHDFHFRPVVRSSEESAEELAEEGGKEESEEAAADSKSHLSILDYVLPVLTRNLKDEEVFRRVLEGLLEKKIPITSKTASAVNDSLANQDLVNLVNKLADPELKLELNETLADVKKFKNLGEMRINNLTSNVEANVEILSKEMASLTSSEDQIKLLRRLAREHKFQEAILLAERLAQQDTGDSDYVYFVFELYKNEKVDLGEKAFSLGVQKGFLSVESRLSLIRLLFARGYPMQAADMLCDLIEEKKRVPGMVTFLNRVVSLRDEAIAKKVLTTMTKYVSENICLAHLTLALARDGELKKAKKLLDSKEFRLTEKTVYNHLEITYRDSTSEQLENILKILKDLEDFDRIPLYKLLLRKYAKDNDVAKAKQLWLLIEEEDISNYDFLEQMREFINNPTVDSLKSLSSKFETVDYSGPVGRITYKSLLEQRNLKKAFSVAMYENIPDHLLKTLISLLAADGKTSEVLQLLSKYNLENSVKETAASLLKHKNVNEYLEFLNHFSGARDFKKIADCFKLGAGLRILQKDEEAFAQYKNLAIKCFENTGMVEPLICYFGACVCAGDKLPEAEKIFEIYFDHLKNVPFAKFKELVKPLEVDFLTNLLSSDKLRSHYSDKLPVIFSNLIVFFCSKNNSKRALDILNTAVNFGIKDDIDKDSLSFLERKLLARGESFPYPELLESEK